MRVLCLPTISKKADVMYESCFIVYYNWAKAMPNHFWNIVLSKTAEVEKLKLPNVEFIKMEDNVEYNSLHSHFPTEITPYFHRSYGKYPVDLILTTRSTIGAVIKKKFMAVRSGASVPTLMFITKAMGKGETHDLVSDIDLKLRGVSYSECPTMFLTEYEKSIAMRSMREYFSANIIQQASKNARVFSQGMDVDKIERIIEGVKKFEKFTYYFGGRFVGNKRWEECLKLLRSMRIADKGESNIVATSPVSKGSKDIDDYETIKINIMLAVVFIFMFSF